MNIFDIFAAASFEYAVYSNLAATDPSEYVTFPTYFNMWKRDYKDLKVSRPVEDICKECYVFANHHRYLANHTMRQDIGDDVHDSDDNNTDADVDSNWLMMMVDHLWKQTSCRLRQHGIRMRR
jgi:hypothetical protein